VSRPSRGHYVIKWIEANCVHTNGEWIGRPFRFFDWQKPLVKALFELRPDGLRRYRWALIGLPKKNGKTELAAALALYLLIGDEEPSPLVVCAAASEEQADLVFGAARTMAEMSPTLSQVTERYEKEILVPSLPGARLRRVAAVAGTNDGQNIHAVVCDELHEWAGPKGEQVWNVLTNGTGARRQPLVLQTTTAGYDLEGTICGRQYLHGKRVQGGEVVVVEFYFYCR
jgi:phage terminase large subunit-like protein